MMAQQNCSKLTAQKAAQNLVTDCFDLGKSFHAKRTAYNFW
jgi:hypothetical protein